MWETLLIFEDRIKDVLEAALDEMKADPRTPLNNRNNPSRSHEIWQ